MLLVFHVFIAVVVMVCFAAVKVCGHHRCAVMVQAHNFPHRAFLCSTFSVDIASVPSDHATSGQTVVPSSAAVISQYHIRHCVVLISAPSLGV